MIGVSKSGFAVAVLMVLALSFTAAGQSNGDKRPIEVHLGEALSSQEIAELLKDPSFLRRQAEHWRSAGYPDIPVEVLPPEVRDIVGRTEGVIPPETFFTAEVQNALLAAIGEASEQADEGGPEARIARHRRNGWPDIPVAVLPKGVRKDLGLADGTIPPEVFYGVQMQEALTEHLGPVAWDESREIGIDPNEDSVTGPTMEEVQQTVQRELGPGTLIVRSPGVLQAFEDHAGDEVALRQAIEAAVPSLSPEMQQSLQGGFQIAKEDVDLPLRKRKHGSTPGRLPTEEVLQRISLQSQTALAGHRELLDDRWALIRALPNMPERTRRAAREFLGKLTEPVSAAELLPADVLREIERAQERGYFETPGAPSGTQLLAAIGQSELASNEAAIGPQDSLFAAPVASYSRLEDHIAIHADFPTVPTDYIKPGSRNYVVPTAGGSSQIYSSSAFGPRLHIEESDAVNFTPHIPNLTIAGNDGTVIWEKHEAGAWTTKVSGFNGRKVFHIAVEAKLEGNLRDLFVDMAKAIIESGYGFN